MKKIEYKLEKGLIGVLSDTHVPVRAPYLPPLLFNIFQDVDLILHAGDIVEEAVLKELEAIAPVEAVAGNMDPEVLKRKLGIKKLISLGDISLVLIHGSGSRHDLPFRIFQSFRFEGPQGIVFGHSHQPFLQYREGILLFNPGSVGDPRWGSEPSCGLLKIEKGQLRGEIVSLK